MQPISSAESPIFKRNSSAESPNLEDTANNDNVLQIRRLSWRILFENRRLSRINWLHGSWLLHESLWLMCSSRLLHGSHVLLCGSWFLMHGSRWDWGSRRVSSYVYLSIKPCFCFVVKTLCTILSWISNQVCPILRNSSCTKVWDFFKIVIKYQIKLWRHKTGLRIHNQSNTSCVWWGMTKIYPKTSSRVPFRGTSTTNTL